MPCLCCHADMLLPMPLLLRLFRRHYATPLLYIIADYCRCHAAMPPHIFCLILLRHYFDYADAIISRYLLRFSLFIAAADYACQRRCC